MPFLHIFIYHYSKEAYHIMRNEIKKFIPSNYILTFISYAFEKGRVKFFEKHSRESIMLPSENKIIIYSDYKVRWHNLRGL